MAILGPRGMANLDPRGMEGRIYIGDNQTLLHIKLLALGLMVSEKQMFEGSLAGMRSVWTSGTWLAGF